MDNNILVQNLCKQFEDFSLDNVSFKVPKGRIVGFIGENGAGKSTTINLILNELSKDSGQIQVFGIDHTIPTVKENIGVVFDECNFHDVFTAADIEKILKEVYKTWDSNLFSQYLKKFKIPTKKTIGTFSKGMKMKLSIICAMAHRPKLLILDEATTGLDPVVRDEVLDLFLEFIQDEDCSIFFSSHITSDIQKIADYVILIHQGKIIFEEQKDDLVYNYGVAKCGKEKFAQLSSDDYIIHRTTNMSVECLVHDKEAFKRKYKNIIVDISIFFKSIDKKLILIATAAIVLLIFNAGIYAGLFASVMFAMTIGMQNIMSFASDEKASWKKYQLAMPISNFTVVASKYVSVIYTVAISILGSIAFNSLSIIIFQNFDMLIWLFSIAAAIIIPLLWTGICLPLTYWFGFRSAQTMGLIVVIPMFYFVKYFEDGPGMAAMVNSVHSYVLITGIAAILIFGISLIISTIGYSRKN